MTQQLLTGVGCFLFVVAFMGGTDTAWSADPTPITIAEIQHDGPVDFEREVLPLLRKKCLACHNAANPEGDLVLETPQAILQGGSQGPATVPGQAAESLLLKAAARQIESVMPPDDNKVGATPLTPDELGLVKRWIDEGAKGEVSGAVAAMPWQPLPPGLNAIYAVAASPDGQFVAASRANQIFLYHLPTRRELGRLTDPALLASSLYQQPGVAHLDHVQSLRFSPDGQLLASGGFRKVKLWQRESNVRLAALGGFETAPRAAAVSSDGKLAAVGEENGAIRLFQLSGGQPGPILAGHTGPVTSLAFTGDGTRLVSGSLDKSFRVWRLADNSAVAAVATPAPILAVALVQSDAQLATGGDDAAIRLWPLPADATPVAEVRQLAGHGGPITALAAIPGAPDQLASASQDGTIRLWDVANGGQLRQVSQGGPVTAIALRPDGQQLAAASSSGFAKLWNVADGKQLAEWRGDETARTRVAAANRLVAVAKRVVANNHADLKAAQDRVAEEEKLAAADGELLKKAVEEHQQKIEAVKQPVEELRVAETAVAAAQQLVAKAVADDKAADALLTQATAETTTAQAALAASETRLQQAAASAVLAKQALSSSLAKLQADADANAGNKELAELLADLNKSLDQTIAARQQAAEQAKQAAVAMIAAAQAKAKAAADAKQAAATAQTAAQAELKKAEEQTKKATEVAQKAKDEQAAAEKALQAAMRSAERATTAVAKAREAVPGAESQVKAAEENVRQQELQAAAAQQHVAAQEQPLWAIAFSPDGATVATAGEDQTVRTWDVASGAALDSYTGQGGKITAVAFTAERGLLSVAANQTGIVWRAYTEWKLARTIGSADSTAQFVDRVTALDFSPDGAILATGGGDPSRSGELKLWNVADGSLLHEIKQPHSDTIFDVAFSPDGQWLASSAADRFARVFEVATGKLVRAFEGHTHHVLGVTWRADGRRLATGGADSVIKIWDARTGDQLRTISGFGKEVTAVEFLGETDQVAAASGDATVQMKNAENGGNVRGFGGAADYVYALSATASGKLIVAGGQDSVVRVWQEDGQVLVTFAPPPPPQS